MNDARFILAHFSIVLTLLLFIGCANAVEKSAAQQQDNAEMPRRQVVPKSPAKQNSGKVIHVVVALCDNESQGIVPVPAKIGNGDDPANNLYWGAAFGVKTFFRRSKEWQLLEAVPNPKANILERITFKHKTKDVYLVADAYRGREIKQSIVDFLSFSAGRKTETISIGGGAKQNEIYIGGSSDLLVYVGHDGLMDFSLSDYPARADERNREAIVLACISKSYFREPLQKAGAKPLIWTTGLMAPEAYILEAALIGWTTGETNVQIRKRAAEAYNKYQKCGLRAANKLFDNT